MIGLTVALAAFWGPLAIGVLWLLN